MCAFFPSPPQAPPLSGGDRSVFTSPFLWISLLTPTFGATCIRTLLPLALGNYIAYTIRPPFSVATMPSLIPDFQVLFFLAPFFSFNCDGSALVFLVNVRCRVSNLPMENVFAFSPCCFPMVDLIFPFSSIERPVFLTDRRPLRLKKSLGGGDFGPRPPFFF